jgi:hypothetical protein
MSTTSSHPQDKSLIHQTLELFQHHQNQQKPSGKKNNNDKQHQQNPNFSFSFDDGEKNQKSKHCSSFAMQLRRAFVVA